VPTDIEAKLHRIWSHVDLRLDVLTARVRENRDVMSASEFSRWLFGSGLLELLEANSCDGFLKVDGAHLRWKCEELTRQCADRFRLNDSQPHLEALQLQALHEKLNTVAGYLSRLVSGPGASSSPTVPPLQIISGGLDGSAIGEPDKRSTSFAVK